MGCSVRSSTSPTYTIALIVVANVVALIRFGAHPAQDSAGHPLSSRLLGHSFGPRAGVPVNPYVPCQQDDLQAGNTDR